MYKLVRIAVALILIFAGVGGAFAQQLNLAVASNALAALKTIGALFEQQTGYRVLLSSGSTGKLYSQIINGAPFDVFLAANESEPQKLAQSGYALPESVFTYAVGKLIAWSADTAALPPGADLKSVLQSASVTRIAIANPKTAPYGLAAQQTLQKLGVWAAVRDKTIYGENVSQAYQYAVTRNAQIAFVAKAQIQDLGTSGSYQEIPQSLYIPIRQQAVILSHAKNPETAAQFAAFLKSENIQNILESQFGYGSELYGPQS